MLLKAWRCVPLKYSESQDIQHRVLAAVSHRPLKIVVLAVVAAIKHDRDYKQSELKQHRVAECLAPCAEQE